MSLKSLNIVLAALLLAVSGAAFANTFTRLIAKEVKELSSPSAQTKQFAPGTSYTLCFVPNGPACESLLVNTINNTRSSLLIQAYSFTSPPIAEAVVNAFKRGVDVRVIIDKSQVSEKYSSATFLKNAGIPVIIDTKPAIAHNKVMIFDQQSVFTGSFNFTRSAQDRNAENGMVIHDDVEVVKAYTANWTTRHQLSSAY
jgi:phosphatidylserine/phosphatidylglycerophosphate/cardiolipin synthase-like enzyme